MNYHWPQKSRLSWVYVTLLIKTTLKASVSFPVAFTFSCPALPVARKKPTHAGLWLSQGYLVGESNHAPFKHLFITHSSILQGTGLAFGSAGSSCVCHSRSPPRVCGLLEQPPRLTLKLWSRVAQWKEKPPRHLTWLPLAAGETKSRTGSATDPPLPGEGNQSSGRQIVKMLNH